MTDMADRELLEYAAKAAGIETYRANDGVLLLRSGEIWNPSEHDRQAFRLAVKLRIYLALFDDTIVPSRAVTWRAGSAVCSLWEPEGNDPYAATRRAITRAAAAIGKEMP